MIAYLSNIWDHIIGEDGFFIFYYNNPPEGRMCTINTVEIIGEIMLGRFAKEISEAHYFNDDNGVPIAIAFRKIKGQAKIGYQYNRDILQNWWHFSRCLFDVTENLMREDKQKWIKKMWRAHSDPVLVGELWGQMVAEDIVGEKEISALKTGIAALAGQENDSIQKYRELFIPEEKEAVTAYFIRLYNLIRSFRKASDQTPLVIAAVDPFYTIFRMLPDAWKEDLGLVFMDGEEVENVLQTDSGVDSIRGKIVLINIELSQKMKVSGAGEGIDFVPGEIESLYRRLRKISEHCVVIWADRDDDLGLSALQKKIKVLMSKDKVANVFEFSERNNYRDSDLNRDIREGKGLQIGDWCFINFLSTAFLEIHQQALKRRAADWGNIVTVGDEGEIVNLKQGMEKDTAGEVCGRLYDRGDDLEKKLVFWPDYTSGVNYGAGVIPDYMKLSQMEDGLRELFFRDEGRWLAENIRLSFGQQVDNNEVRNIFITHFQGGGYQTVLRVTIQLVDGEERDFGIIMAKSGPANSALTERDYNNLSQLYAKDNRFIPQPYSMDSMDIGNHGKEQRVVFSVQWLPDHKELQHEKDVFAINTYGMEKRFTIEETNRIKQKIITILASYYNPGKKEMIGDVQINAGDFVYDISSEQTDVKLITARGIRKDIAPEDFINYIVNFRQTFMNRPVVDFIGGDINNLAVGLAAARGVKTAVQWLVAYRNAVGAGRIKENEKYGIGQIDRAIGAIESLVVKGKKTRLSPVVRFIDEAKNSGFLSGILGQDTKKILIRVPVKALRQEGEDDMKSFLDCLGKVPNIYLELYSGEKGVAPDSIYQEYGIVKEAFPDKRDKTNTLTLLAWEKDKQIEPGILTRQLGLGRGEDTVAVPVGPEEDPLGLIRGILLGLKIIAVARQYKEGKHDITFIQDTVTEYNSLFADGDNRLNISDIIHLASGNVNEVTSALRILIALLPDVREYNMEEIKDHYLQAAEAIDTAA